MSAWRSPLLSRRTGSLGRTPRLARLLVAFGVLSLLVPAGLLQPAIAHGATRSVTSVESEQAPGTPPAPVDTTPVGTWIGTKTASSGGSIPGDGDVLAAGTSAPAGPAQFTYGALDPDPNGGSNSPSGSWAFYTTAGSDGTVTIPWHWTGFHGFAAVSVKLDAFVIGANSPDSNVTLEQHGPQSCNPCTPPSGGFDYQGTHDFTVHPGDQYGFTITTSNGDSNASQYGQLILGELLPHDCADAQALYGATTDGRYVIHPQGGQTFSVDCVGMSEVARDYLRLHVEHVGPGLNYSSYAAGGASPGTTVTTSFTKVRLDPGTLRIDIGDLAYATTSGGPLTHSASGDPQAVTSMSYATAMACNVGTGGFDGQANVDLAGTPFAIDDKWTPGGTGAIGNYDQLRLSGESFVFDPQIANVIGNGNCGWESPDPAAYNPFNLSPGNFGLQLRYLSAPTTPPAPVMFRAIPNAVSSTETGIVGRLDAAPGDYDITLYASSTCVQGLLGNDAVALGTAAVTIGANDATYFSQLVTHAASTRRYVALSATRNGQESERSTCIVSTADNDVWPRATRLTAGSTAATVQGWVDQPGLARWYKFHVDPGAQVTVNMSSLPADFDVFLFKDIQQAYDEQAALASTSDLTKLSAEFASTNIAPQGYAPQGYAPQGYAPQAYAPDAFAPQGYAPQAYAPQGYAPQAYAPQGYAPQAYAPQGYAPQGYAPQAYAPQGYAPQAYAPAVFLPQAYASAQVTSLFALSAQAGTGSETIVANTWNNTGDFYIRVSGKNGASSTDAPFTLSVAEQSSICAGLNVDAHAPMIVGGAPSTLILTYPDQMKSTTAGNSATDKAALQTRLASFATQVNGSNVGVIDVAADPGVAAMTAQAEAKPACPFAKNLVAHEIKDIIDAYRSAHPGALKYIVLVGDDSVIPFFRYPDQALLGPEQDFIPPVGGTTSSEASLRLNYVLGQDEYGARVVLSHGVSTLPIPDIAVGRLVETAADASTALDGFLALSSGVLPTPKSSLVTGYDFIADASSAIATDFQQGIGSGVGTRHDTLITPFDVSPLDARSWTATQLKGALATRHDMLFLGGHFSADSALAADFSTTISTADLAGVDLTNAVVVSIGCHSGYNTVDAHGIPSVTNTLDWAQAFARKKATLIAGTGYQYGDTDFIEYSERIYVELARELRRGLGPVALGDALVRSKQTYLRTTNDLRGLHEKALLESVLYGLPMTAVDLPNRLPAETSSSIIAATDSYGVDPGSTLGLRSANVTVNPTLTPGSLTMKVYGDASQTSITAHYSTGSAGVASHQNEPVLPLESRNVTVPGQILRGVLWTGGHYAQDQVVPLTGAPATETRGVHTRFASPVFFPIKPWAVNYTGALTSAGGSTQLLVMPTQHEGSLTSDLATRRTFSSMGFKLFYSSYLGQAALSAAPQISGINAIATGDQVTFEATVTGDVAAGVQEVWIVYTTGPDATGNGNWVSLQLAQDATDSTLWRGTAGITGGASIKYLVQAVNGLGLVTMNENYGEFYAVEAAGAQPQPRTATSLTVSGPGTGSYTGIASFTATLKAGGTALAGRAVVVSIGGIARVATTNSSGVASVDLPLDVLPGTYDVSGTFPGDDEYMASSAARSIIVNKAMTSLTLDAAAAVPSSDGSVTLLATLKSGATPLVGRSVAFLITPSTGAVKLVTSTTDLFGRARLVFAGGTTGVKQTEARFGTVVSVTNGPTVDLTDARYSPSSAITWPFTGFLAPVDNMPTINGVKAGSAVPVKFSLGGNRGLTIFRAGYPRVTAVACATGAPIDDIETTVAATTSGLQYDATTGQYTYIWKTGADTGCYRLDLVFTDGTVRSALFKLK